MVKAQNYEDYIVATEVAKKFGVSIHTIRRRMQEGKLFKGAIKVKLSSGERWLIPRSEISHLSMEQVSPRLFQERYKNRFEELHTKAEEQLSPKSNQRSLEERVSVLERLLLKHIA